MEFGAWKRKVLNLNKGNSFSSLPVLEDNVGRVNEGKEALSRGVRRRAIRSVLEPYLSTSNRTVIRP